MISLSPPWFAVDTKVFCVTIILQLCFIVPLALLLSSVASILSICVYMRYCAICAHCFAYKWQIWNMASEDRFLLATHFHYLCHLLLAATMLGGNSLIFLSLNHKPHYSSMTLKERGGRKKNGKRRKSECVTERNRNWNRPTVIA